MYLKLSRRKLITIFTIALMIVNILVALLIFVDIQIINAPETEVFIDIVEVNSEEVIIDAEIKMHNSNSFDIGIQDFTITSMNYENEELTKINIKGGNVPSDETKIFKERGKIILKDSEKLTQLKNKVSGKISVTVLGFITKTIPIDLMIFTSVDKIFENLEIPEFHTTAYFTGLSEDGLEFTAEVSVNNPTSLTYYVDNLLLDFTTEKGESLGSVDVDGGEVESEKSRVFYSNGIVHYDAFNAGKLIMRLNGVAGAKIAGLNKNISFSTDASLIIPDIKDFVFDGEELDFRIPVQFKLRARGIISTVGFSLYNPSNVSIIGENLVCKIYRQDREKQYLLGEELMQKCEIPTGERDCIKTEITIPYFKYFSAAPLKIIPDWIILRIEGDFHIAGTDQSFPLALNAYVDPHIIRNSEFLT